MDKNSPAYTIGFAAAVTIVCALLLGFAATNLKEQQEINMDVDKKSKILQAIGEFDPKASNLSSKEILAFFTKEGKDSKFVVKFAVNHDGEVVKDLSVDRIKAIDLEQEMKKEQAERQYPIFAFFESKDDYAQNNPSNYVIPVYGYGLWSYCYGVMAIEKDCKTVKNLVYYKHGETPGLGGEIEKKKFSDSFVGMKIHNAQGEVALTTAKEIKDKTTQVPAISGATFTMNGVDKMLKDYLTIYDVYFKKVLAGGTE